MLECRELCAGYGTKTVIENINLKFLPNRIYALIGPSGCGKSTLLTTFNGLISENGGFYRGSIYYNGRDKSEWNKAELRRKIGIVFQKPTVFPMSIYDNLTYAPKFFGTTKKSELKNIVERVLKEASLFDEVKDKLKENAASLSGGQQQRLCIARTLSAGPEVLLLDEPCASLDLINTAKIESLLKKLAKTMLIIIVTHNLQQARRIADETIFMLDGKIIEHERTAILFENPKSKVTSDYINGVFG
jgi:phosphate transport system ATP-binding protein